MKTQDEYAALKKHNRSHIQTTVVSLIRFKSFPVFPRCFAACRDNPAADRQLIHFSVLPLKPRQSSV